MSIIEPALIGYTRQSVPGEQREAVLHNMRLFAQDKHSGLYVPERTVTRFEVSYINALNKFYERLEKNEDLKRALEIAYEAHEGQRRRSGLPYISHPVGVAALMTYAGYGKEEIIGALFHDVPEDTNVTIGQLEKDFLNSRPVIQILKTITNDNPLKYEGRCLHDQSVLPLKTADVAHNAIDFFTNNHEIAQHITSSQVDKTIRFYHDLALLLNTKYKGDARLCFLHYLLTLNIIPLIDYNYLRKRGFSGLTRK
ncbi:MAG: HD domain-containing protein [Candidatus Micrarchaeota archaeon]|nr:HD domain-containing protein [Candidatus Micrarchaeota archaeon]